MQVEDGMGMARMAQMKTSYFITATGTDLGKTWLTAGVLRACRAAGRPVRALKPVMSGYAAATHADSDVGQLGVTPEELDAVAPWRFAAPLSPDRAAALEGRAIDFAALLDWCRGEIAHDNDGDGLLLVEGIGGVMVPLDAHHTVRDWIAALEIPVVLVCGNYLGALSHTLTALAALREVGVVPAHIVVNESAESSVSLDDTLASLAPHAAGVPLHVLRRGREDDLVRLTAVLASN